MGKNEINAFLGAGTAYQGRLTFHGIVRIDGTFDGDIVSDGTLMVGKDAHVSGRLSVARLFCGGLVEAEVLAARKVVLHRGGTFRGSIRTPALVVEDGAKVEGRVLMSGPDQEPMAIDVTPAGHPA
ncbi:polymer-forming cytoskeletal protein [Desulfolutivibrio sulfoxidireducens]|nr:polymer-forming cytoskeletal protein [Desulfolutivibrio sulfoxidireducens]QLA17989.1 polymer-forming cytoskeletal protein [Desulfolutivibrio sulfoxidireducens]QLA21564.1 polymer-forming cytoskeletal protein [Desulfolutivibrio sulfoxidireducens]